MLHIVQRTELQTRGMPSYCIWNIYPPCHCTEPSTLRAQHKNRHMTCCTFHFISHGKISLHLFHNGMHAWRVNSLFPWLRCPCLSFTVRDVLCKVPPVPQSCTRRKPWSCHGSWTEAGMYITIPGRETERERNVVKWYHFVAARATLSSYWHDIKSHQGANWDIKVKWERQREIWQWGTLQFT